MILIPRNPISHQNCTNILSTVITVTYAGHLVNSKLNSKFLHFSWFSDIYQLRLFHEFWVLQFDMQLLRLNISKDRFFPVSTNWGKKQLRQRNLTNSASLSINQRWRTKANLSDKTCNKCHPNFVLHLTTLFMGALNAASSNSGTCKHS